MVNNIERAGTIEKRDIYNLQYLRTHDEPHHMLRMSK